MGTRTDEQRGADLLVLIRLEMPAGGNPAEFESKWRAAMAAVEAGDALESALMATGLRAA